MQKLKVLELFAGIGACSKALERLNIPHEIVDAVEIDKYAIKSFNAIHGTNFEPQDITTWDKDIKVDLIMHGSPCQDFSLAGKQAGGDEGSGTRSSLMYETIRIVAKLKPKYVVWENVKNLLSKKHRHNFDAYLQTMEQLGYNNYYQVLNAKDYLTPQNRERVLTISIRNDIDKDFHFPEKQPLKLRLKDLLEDEVDEKYYLSKKMIEYISANNAKYSGNNNKSLINKSIASTINTGEGQRRCDASNYISKQVDENFDLKIMRDFGIYGDKQGGSVFNPNGLSPTLTTKSSLNWNVLINEESFVSKKYNDFINKNGYIPDMFKPYNNAEIKDIAPTQSTQCGSTTSSSTILIRNKSLRETLEQNDIEKDISYIDAYNRNIRKDDLSGTITTRVNDSNNTFIAIKNATKQGYLEAHDGDGCYITNIDKKRGTVQKEMIPTLKTSPDIGCVTTDLRIRKLTPKECWRLMGFDDVDFEKAEKINSNTQLYKQAGNSIVVNVLEAIFKELLSEYIPNLDKWSDLD